MECKCGGETTERSHTKTVDKQLIAKLVYDCCKSCGMAGRFILYERGEVTEKGNSARFKFDEEYN